MATKLLGAIAVSGWSIDIDTGGAPETVNITNGTYYLSGDGGSDDLFTELATQINAATLVVDTFTCGIVPSTNFVQWEMDDGTYNFDISGAGTLQQIMRFASDTFTMSAGGSLTIDGTREPRYFAHSDTATNIDVPTDIGRTSLSEADDGTITGVDVGPTVSQYRVKLRYSGPHRTSTANGYTEFRDFWVYVIKPGGLFRWYPDTTVTTAWAELTNPNGYHSVKALEPRKFTPAEVIRDYYGWYTTTFLLQVQP